MSLKQDEIDLIASAVTEKLVNEKRAYWVDPETHAEHHEWVKKQIESEKDRRKFRQQVIRSSILWAVPIVIAFVVTSTWKELIRVFGE